VCAAICMDQLGDPRNSGCRHAKIVHKRLAARRKSRLVYDKERRTIVDPRDPDYSRIGMFVLHNCARCDDGKKPCVIGNPSQCEYPHARND